MGTTHCSIPPLHGDFTESHAGANKNPNPNQKNRECMLRTPDTKSPRQVKNVGGE